MYLVAEGDGGSAVKDQVHIRNAEAAQLARALARQSGKTIEDVVLDALRQYRPLRSALLRRKQVQVWRQYLRQDRRGMARKETPIETLYDDVMPDRGPAYLLTKSS
jgi:hypothetical protein